MKTNFLILTLALYVTARGYSQDTSNLPSSRVDSVTAYTFSGKIVFLQKGSNVIYDLTVVQG